MLRGIHKKMIAVKTPSSSPFECAYFILRNDISEEIYDKRAMLREAQRILSESQPRQESQRARFPKAHARLFGFLLFLLGFFSGAFLLCLLWATL